MSFGGGSSKSTNTPVDMTPDAFKALQNPLAARLAGLLGFGATTTPATTGTRGFNPTGAPGATQGPQNANGSFGPNGPNRFVNSNWTNGDHQGMPRGLPPIGQPGATGGTAGTPGGLQIGGFNGGPDGLGGIPTYNGPLTAPIGANEQTILDKLMANANGTAPDSDATAGLKEFLRRGLNGNAATDNPFLQSYIEAAQRPTMQGLEETLTRSLPGRFTQNGQFTQPQGSSAFDRAAAIATRGAADASGDIATKISYNQVNDAQNRGLDAAKALPGVNAQEVDTMVKNLQAQALPRLIQENGIERGLALFNTRLDGLLKTLGIAAGVTQPTIANEGKSKSSQFSLGIPKG